MSAVICRRQNPNPTESCFYPTVPHLGKVASLHGGHAQRLVVGQQALEVGAAERDGGGGDACAWGRGRGTARQLRGLEGRREGRNQAAAVVEGVDRGDACTGVDGEAGGEAGGILLDDAVERGALAILRAPGTALNRPASGRRAPWLTHRRRSTAAAGRSSGRLGRMADLLRGMGGGEGRETRGQVGVSSRIGREMGGQARMGGPAPAGAHHAFPHQRPPLPLCCVPLRLPAPTQQPYLDHRPIGLECYRRASHSKSPGRGRRWMTALASASSARKAGEREGWTRACGCSGAAAACCSWCCVAAAWCARGGAAAAAHGIVEAAAAAAAAQGAVHVSGLTDSRAGPQACISNSLLPWLLGVSNTPAGRMLAGLQLRCGMQAVAGAAAALSNWPPPPPIWVALLSADPARSMEVRVELQALQVPGMVWGRGWGPPRPA